MQTIANPGRLQHLTFRGNLANTRHGWLRLTPAYSVHLVSEIIGDRATDGVVLDPFCGTGTTSLACAERGIPCDTSDINPFLLWLTKAKTRRYSEADVDLFRLAARDVIERALNHLDGPTWLPPLHQIEKWWERGSLIALGRVAHEISQLAEQVPDPVIVLLKVAFCRTMIERANVSFGHQSMSFRQASAGGPMLDLLFAPEDAVRDSWTRAVRSIGEGAASQVIEMPRPVFCDARELSTKLPTNHYSAVVTSPPYPNRMSYIRELRPYMYWLGYLRDGRQAGEMDWQAIGGTWGCATSNLSRWVPETAVTIPSADFEEMILAISRFSPLLSRYVYKYFCDMVAHAHELYAVVRGGGTISYIVGNSKFYDVLVPVQAIFAAIFTDVGFEAVSVDTIRKRTSKRELFEYLVSARKP